MGRPRDQTNARGQVREERELDVRPCLVCVALVVPSMLLRRLSKNGCGICADTSADFLFEVRVTANPTPNRRQTRTPPPPSNIRSIRSDTARRPFRLPANRWMVNESENAVPADWTPPPPSTQTRSGHVCASTMLAESRRRMRANERRMIIGSVHAHRGPCLRHRAFRVASGTVEIARRLNRGCAGERNVAFDGSSCVNAR